MNCIQPCWTKIRLSPISFWEPTQWTCVCVFVWASVCLRLSILKTQFPAGFRKNLKKKRLSSEVAEGWLMFRNVYLSRRSWRQRGKRFFFPSTMTLWVHSGRELKINWDQRISLWRPDVATGKWNAKSAGGASWGALPPPLLPVTAGPRLKWDGQGQPEECRCNDITNRHISASILPVTPPPPPSLHLLPSRCKEITISTIVTQTDLLELIAGHNTSFSMVIRKLIGNRLACFTRFTTPPPLPTRYAY